MTAVMNVMNTRNRGTASRAALVAISVIASVACSSEDAPIHKDARALAVDGARVDSLEDAYAWDRPPMADAGVDLSEAERCKALGLAGKCEGDVLLFCALGEVKTRDCGAEFSARGIKGSCGFLSQEWGNDCLIDVGEACKDEDVCNGMDSGCILSTGGKQTCQPKIGLCDPDKETSPRCLGDLLVERCEVSQQRFGVDCKALGGHCSLSAPACVELPQGAPCDAKLRRCASPLVCKAGHCAK